MTISLNVFDNSNLDDLSLSSLYLQGVEVNQKCFELLNYLKTIMRSEPLAQSEELKVGFKIVYMELANYISYVLDFKYYERLNLELAPIDTKWGYAHAIQNNLTLADPQILNFEKNRTRRNSLRGFRKIAELVKKYSWKIPHGEKHLFMAPTAFMANYQKAFGGIILPSTPFSHVETKGKKDDLKLREIAMVITRLLEANFSEFGGEGVDIVSIISKTLIYVNSLLETSRKILPSRKVDIYLGTGGSLPTRAIASVVKEREGRVTRFEHGGERVFFDDKFFYSYESFKADRYICFGHLKKSFYEERFKNDSLEHQFTEVTPYHFSNLSNLATTVKSSSEKYQDEFIYVPASFLFFYRQFPNACFDDVFKIKWSSSFLSFLSQKEKVLVKRHPKGFGGNIEYPLAKNLEYIDGYMEQVLSRDGIFIFDHIGSAFIECLAAKKRVVFIDFGLRPLEKRLASTLESVCLRLSFNPDRLDDFFSFHTVEKMKAFKPDTAKFEEFLNNYVF